MKGSHICGGGFLPPRYLLIIFTAVKIQGVSTCWRWTRVVKASRPGGQRRCSVTARHRPTSGQLPATHSNEWPVLHHWQVMDCSAADGQT